MRRQAKSRIAFGVAGVLLALLLAFFGAMLYFHDQAAEMSPAPDAPQAEPDSDGFPVVDWAYWHSINPDVIGWITIPGTVINYPIVQAQESDPDYYLKHDVHRNYNVYGCPYLDAGCREGGLFGSLNAVTFGHHMNDGSMFAAVADYSDKSFSASHSRILVQTPEEKRVYEVQAAEIIPGWKAAKRVEFKDTADFLAYYSERFDGCKMKLVQNCQSVEQTGHVLTLCTCSYNYWSQNERTLVYGASVKSLPGNGS